MGLHQQQLRLIPALRLLLAAPLLAAPLPAPLLEITSAPLPAAMPLLVEAPLAVQVIVAVVLESILPIRRRILQEAQPVDRLSFSLVSLLLLESL